MSLWVTGSYLPSLPLLALRHDPAMATLSQLHLARAAFKLHLPNSTARASPCRIIPIHAAGILNLRISTTKRSNVVVAAGIKEPHAEVEPAAMSKAWWAAAAAGSFTAAFPADAVIPDEIEEMMRFSPEAWVNIYITTGVWLVLYFLVIPLVVYNYLRLRWYKRSFVETYFQFMLVFVFFPGMLLLAPFINFRRLPKNGAKEPWE